MLYKTTTQKRFNPGDGMTLVRRKNPCQYSNSVNGAGLEYISMKPNMTSGEPRSCKSCGSKK